MYKQKLKNYERKKNISKVLSSVCILKLKDDKVSNIC